MINDAIKATGALSVKLYAEDGSLKQTLDIPNLVVLVGRQFIAARMKTTGQPVEMTHMSIGSGTVAPASGDTTLGTELGRVANTIAGGTVSSNTIQYSATFPAGTGTGAITEAGIFNAASAGTMLARTTFAVVNKGVADSISITWTVTIS